MELERVEVTKRPAGENHKHDGYVFDTGQRTEQARLTAHNALWDPFTFRKLDELAVGNGWRCLEIGAGIGSVAIGLADRVAPDGSVVATDIETSLLNRMAGPNLEVRRHNVASDPLERGAFDLIHARLVLEHLPSREAVLEDLVQALRPGGWLVIEDYDLRPMSVIDPELPAWTAVNDAILALLQSRGVDPLYGSRLLNRMREVGLVDVDAEGFTRSIPVPDLAAVFRPVTEQFRPSIIETAMVTNQEFDQALGQFEGHSSPASTYTPILVSARGQRPAARYSFTAPS